MILLDIKYEKGLAMPLTLIVILVLIMLGTSLWHYSMADLKHASLESQKMQAYYHARSGAELLALKVDFNEDNNPIIKTPTGDILLQGQESLLESNFVSFGNEDLDILIQVYKKDADIIIISIGRVNHLSETLKLTIRKDGDDRITFWERSL